MKSTPDAGPERHFVVKTDSLYNILIAAKMHTTRIPKDSAVCIKLATLLYF